MSTLQSRAASMGAAVEAANSPSEEHTETALETFKSISLRSIEEHASTDRTRRSETYFEPEVAVRAYGDADSYESSRDATKNPHPVSLQPRATAPVPRITIHAFCESPDVLAAVERASGDRLMSRSKLDIFAGGIKAATAYYQHNPAPNLIVVEGRASNDAVLCELEELAEYCDTGTKVLVIGYSNDISFYRELMQRGVSDYIVAPVNALSLIASISNIYQGSSTNKLGQIYAFVGSKGGVGSSTVAHNVGWSIARTLNSDVVVADLDLPFGTAGLNFNVDAQQGIAEAIQDAGRLDDVLFDRLLTRYDDHLSILTAPGTLGASYDLQAHAFSGLLEIAQANVPFTILDVPHLWTSWARNALVAADEIIITAVPDLANLRNAKSLIDFLLQARPNDASPKLLLNQVGMAKRPEIKPAEFARTLQIEPLACIPFDAQLFGTAANNGKVISDVSAKSPAAQSFADIAAAVTGRKEPKKSRKGPLGLQALLSRIARKPR